MWSKTKRRIYQKAWRKQNSEHIKIYKRIYNKKDKGLYVSYACLRQRCLDKSRARYKDYGGRGIKCFWISYKEFKEDMGESYFKHLAIYGRKNTTIERINNDKGYCKENCRWATAKEQRRNQRVYKLKS